MATLVFAYATMAFMDQVTALTAADLNGWLVLVAVCLSLFG